MFDARIKTIKNAIVKSRLLWIVLGACFILFIGLGIIFYKQIDPKLFHTWATGLSAWLVFALLAFLPLIGFPVSLLFVVVGAKFGSAWGTVWVSVAIAIHLVITYWITTTFLHDRIASIFKKTRYKMPKIPMGEHVPVTLLTALVPGVPYAAKNYLLVLAGVPWRTYVCICLPAHIFHATLAIIFGDLTEDLTTGRVVFLSAYAAVVILLGRYVVKRLQNKRAAAVVSGEVLPK